MEKRPNQHSTHAITADLKLRQASSDLAKTLSQPLHLPGARDMHRTELKRIIKSAISILEELTDDPFDKENLNRTYLILLKAYLAQAHDAFHGANQLAQGSQRAPTREDCEDGWQRVESIVRVAEDSAQKGKQCAERSNLSNAYKIANQIKRIANDARRIIDERNHAYTFHTSSGFSFGEGWYVAAAAVLDNIEIQIEDQQSQSVAAKRFLSDAGLVDSIIPYRSRPRANKHLPAIIAEVFQRNPNASQKKLRKTFLGDQKVPKAIAEWADKKLVGRPKTKKLLLWIRYSQYHAMRNTDHEELIELIIRARTLNLMPILIGDALQEKCDINEVIDMTLFWKRPIFTGEDMRRAQLYLFEYLKAEHHLIGQIGVTTAGMDGPALMGLNTIYITQEPNVRLGKWVGLVPGYVEIVREGNYLSRIQKILEEWKEK